MDLENFKATSNSRNGEIMSTEEIAANIAVDSMPKFGQGDAPNFNPHASSIVHRTSVGTIDMDRVSSCFLDSIQLSRTSIFSSHVKKKCRCRTENSKNFEDNCKASTREKSTNSIKNRARLSEIITQDDIDAMDTTQLRSSLENSLLENSNLIEQLESKEEYIVEFKQKLCVLLDNTHNNSRLKDSKKKHSRARNSDFKKAIMSRPSRAVVNSNLCLSLQYDGDVDDEASDDDCSLDGAQISTLQQSITNLLYFRGLHFDQSAIKEIAIDVIHVSNQLLLGGFTGFGSAYFVQKFGKLALAAVGGGSILLVYACRRGYIQVNWSDVCKSIFHLPDDGLHKPDKDSSTPADYIDSIIDSTPIYQDWAVKKAEGLKDWVKAHSFSVGGFILGFAYKSL